MKGELFDIEAMIELDEGHAGGKIREEEKEWVSAEEFLSSRNRLRRSLRSFSDGLSLVILIFNLK